MKQVMLLKVKRGGGVKGKKNKEITPDKLKKEGRG